MARRKNAAAVKLVKLRNQKLTPERRSEIARTAAAAAVAGRMAKLSPEQRSAIAKKAAEQMWAKKRAAGAVKKTGKKKAGGPETDGLSEAEPAG